LPPKAKTEKINKIKLDTNAERFADGLSLKRQEELFVGGQEKINKGEEGSRNTSIKKRDLSPLIANTGT